MRDHTKLRAFELTDELVIMTYRITRNFPKEEIYGLTSQMKRAGISNLKFNETEKVRGSLIRTLRSPKV